MHTPQDGPSPGGNAGDTPLDEPLSDFLDRRAKTIDERDGERVRSGNYVQALERVVPKWIGKMEKKGVETLEDLSARHMSEYATYLYRRTDAKRKPNDDDGITAATAWNYYSLVSAYLHYCQQWDYLTENPANTAIAKQSLPDRPKTSASDQQFWSTEQRQTITTHVEDRAYDEIDADPGSSDALTAARDRALVYVIGYSGVRGSEVLSSSRDARRNGITWSAVDADNEVLTVYGKSQQEEQAPLTDKPVAALDRWRTLLDPATDEWPVFPSFHLASLREAAREQLEDRGVDEETVAEVTGLGTNPLIDEFRERELVPPALSTEGGRYVLKKLSKAADVDCSDDPKDYLTLHGARRGAGEVYYEAAGAQAAQRALRHADPATTSEMYAHKEASELSDVGSEAFSNEE